jgi:hypothetical protein
MLYLTYLPYIDGMGAQFQRIIGLIALAHECGCIYTHTPVSQMDHITSAEVTEIENFLQINNYYNKNGIKVDNEYTIKSDEVGSALLHFKNQSTTTSILLSIHNCISILDANPNMYDKVMPTLRKIKQTIELVHFKRDIINIAVHIRRGDVSNLQNSDRYLPTTYFKEIIDNLLQQSPGANVCIFTELTPGNKEEFNIFSPNIKIISGGDVLTTFEHLSKADILITSKSSFSYLAALYNENTVMYTNFWHKPLSRWKIL